MFDGIARVLNNMERLKDNNNYRTSGELNTSNINDETRIAASSNGGGASWV